MDSADAWQLFARQPVDHAATTEGGLHLHETALVGTHLADPRRPGAEGVGAQRGHEGVGLVRRADGDELAFESGIRSDTAALHGLVESALAAVPGLRVLRDPTRGGLAATLNEIARQSGVGIVLDEMALPVAPQVAAACEFLGLDPLHIANEGKLIAICPADQADALVAALRAHPLGAQAARIGEVQADERRFVQMKTALGGRRMVDWLAGEQLPRIC